MYSSCDHVISVCVCVCMCVHSLQLASGRLAHSHYDDDGEGGGAPAKKKRRKVVSARVERPKGVAPHFRQVDTSELQEVYCTQCASV